MSSHTETERKYLVDEVFALPDVGFGSTGRQTKVLTARYFDTPDLRLARRGITLRRREGGDDEGWHLKLPYGPDTRQEIRHPLTGPADEVPAQLVELVSGLIRNRPLIPVAVVTTQRTEMALSDADGHVLAELADDRVHAERLREAALTSGPATLEKTWREIEVELVNGSAAVLDRVERRLRKAGARPSPDASKLARTLGTDLAARRRPPSRPRTAGDVLAAYLASQVDTILSHDPLVRLADHDDDTVHKMRVGVRRIRSLLRTHRRILDRDRIAPIDAELKWLADALGEVRDLEVQRARFAGRLAALSRTGVVRSREPAWLADLARRESEARARLRKVLLTPRYFALIEIVEALPTDLPVTDWAARPAPKEIPKLVSRALGKTRRAWLHARALPPGDERDAALHQTRKAAKRLRYTAEAARQVMKGAGKIARRALRLQDLLGEHHDSVVSAHLLTETAKRLDTGAADAFQLGMLTAVEQQEGENALRRVPKVAAKAL